MAELQTLYDGVLHVHSIDIELLTHTKKKVDGTTTETTETLAVHIPEVFQSYEYMIVTDSQGVLTKATIMGHKTQQTVVNALLKREDKYAFVYVTCKSPETRELTKFVDLEKLRKPSKEIEMEKRM